MFDNLTNRLSAIFKALSRKGKLSARDVEDGLREIRIALLEADVSLPVVKDFIARVRPKAVGAEVLESLTPVQHLVKIVRDEMVAMLGGDEPAPRLFTPGQFTPIMLVGLQGGGKTTTAAKLAYHLKTLGTKPALAALDMARPAAIEQLETLGGQIHAPVLTFRGSTPVEAAKGAVERARRDNYPVLILDTAGRLHINDELMAELEAVKAVVEPREIILVVDSMTGQDAVNVARAFDERLGLTGVILTKFDGDARAGAALSIRAVTGKPVRFLGVGEHVDALEAFQPARVVERILGMGDVLSLIEKVEATLDEEQAERIEQRFRKGKFDLEDFVNVMKQARRLGPLKSLMNMLPGVKMTDEMLEMGEKNLVRIEAIISSMTRDERRSPEVLNGSRRKRIASGSGTSVQEINRFMADFKKMQGMMKEMRRGMMPKLT
jgi:signal recognition particle subunit SRP54